MKQSLVLGLALASLSLATSACSDNKGSAETKSTTEKPGSDGTTTPAAPAPEQSLKGFCCSVHPQVMSDKPGSCPTCGRALVAQK